MAAIGEQFLDEVVEGDDICGLSVSPREKDDLIQVRTKWRHRWNFFLLVLHLLLSQMDDDSVVG